MFYREEEEQHLAANLLLYRMSVHMALQDQRGSRGIRHQLQRPQDGRHDRIGCLDG